VLKIFKFQEDLKAYISSLEGRPRVGFVPTMGALHEGHLSLVSESKRKCEITVCSIFVNPTQFNDPADLEKYPRPIGKDIELLELSGCDILYLPAYDDVYKENELINMNFGGLDLRWEGEARPGHFKGMATVVKKLFEAVNPHDVFFGQKDFQQCCIVRKMIRLYKLNIVFHQCPIIREPDGLAMSSRNIRLGSADRKTAAYISKVIFEAADDYQKYEPIQLNKWVIKELSSKGMEVEYAAVVDSANLEPLNLQWMSGAVLLVAVRLGDTRLIDNIMIN
jgi:pantoate--beta-alanine ligase